MTLDENPEADTILANKDIIAAIHDCGEHEYNILIVIIIVLCNVYKTD